MNKQILVVDDEPEIRSLLKEILEEEGFIVELAENAEIANQKRQSQRADLTLLDVWLPDYDGLKLLEEWTLGNDYGGPVIVMTGHGTLETAVEDDFISDYLLRYSESEFSSENVAFLLQVRKLNRLSDKAEVQKAAQDICKDHVTVCDCSCFP